MRTAAALVSAVVLAGLAVAARAGSEPAPLQRAAIVERLGEQLPLDVVLRDSRGRSAPLGEFLGDDPVLLVFGYYHCTMLCGMVLEGAVRGLQALERSAGAGDGRFRLVSISIDPRDDAQSAEQRQRPILEKLGWPEARWPFLTGGESEVRAIARQAGFGYAYDPPSGEYAHSAALVVLAPGGRVSTYLYGIDFPAEKLRAALGSARAGATRSPFERVLLRCLHYIPALRRHGAAVALALRGSALLIAGAFGFWLLRLWRADLAGREP